MGTWYEGIRACKTLAQSKGASGRQSNVAQQINSSEGADKRNSKSVVTTANAFALTPADTSIPISVRTPSIAPVDAFMNKLTVMPGGTSTEYDTDKTNLKTIETTIRSTSANTSITNALTT